jgi:hypothetical protein
LELDSEMTRLYEGKIAEAMKQIMMAYAASVLALALPRVCVAETVGVFFDSGVEQIAFAAGEEQVHG